MAELDYSPNIVHKLNETTDTHGWHIELLLYDMTRLLLMLKIFVAIVFLVRN